MLIKALTVQRAFDFSECFLADIREQLLAQFGFFGAAYGQGSVVFHDHRFVAYAQNFRQRYQIAAMYPEKAVRSEFLFVIADVAAHRIAVRCGVYDNVLVLGFDEKNITQRQLLFTVSGLYPYDFTALLFFSAHGR